MCMSQGIWVCVSRCYNIRHHLGFEAIRKNLQLPFVFLDCSDIYFFCTQAVGIKKIRLVLYTVLHTSRWFYTDQEHVPIHVPWCVLVRHTYPRSWNGRRKISISVIWCVLLWNASLGIEMTANLSCVIWKKCL